jgi:hypothetical protein
MKALFLLDHVMLWIAKGFTAAMLVIFLLPVFMLGFILLMELCIYFLAPHSGRDAFSGSTAIISQMCEREPHKILTLAYMFLCFVSVRLLWSIPARICLGLTSGFLVLGCLMMAVGFAHNGSHLPASGFLLFFLIFALLGIVGFTSMLWVSIHPPKDDHPLLSNHLLPKHLNPV